LRTRRLRRLFSLVAPGRRELVTVGVALTLLPVLVGVAAAQPVIVHKHVLTERVDAQAFLVFDTTRSMGAQSSPSAPTRLERAKREAAALIPQFGDIPVGIATMTDRVLPNLMPTTNAGLLLRTLNQSVAINVPPPSLDYHGFVPVLKALFGIANQRLFAPNVKHPILIVFTDGEVSPLSRGIGYDFASQMTSAPLVVHVWGPDEHLYVDGRIDAKYRPDPASGAVRGQFAKWAHGRVFAEGDTGSLLRTVQAEAGSKPATTQYLGYARMPLAPWFLLAGVVPLGFLFWRRNL
jgi:hypothetical protein